jgi:hypothetical protein
VNWRAGARDGRGRSSPRWRVSAVLPRPGNAQPGPQPEHRGHPHADPVRPSEYIHRQTDTARSDTDQARPTAGRTGTPHALGGCAPAPADVKGRLTGQKRRPTNGKQRRTKSKGNEPARPGPGTGRANSRGTRLELVGPLADSLTGQANHAAQLSPRDTFVGEVKKD